MMLRTFRQHRIRTTDTLDGFWQCAVGADIPGRKKKPSLYPRHVHVPCSWEMIPGLESYRGTAWFKKKIPHKTGFATRLVFGGVSHTANVYVDKKHRGSHYDAYTPWSILISSGKKESSECIVEVDNSFGEHSALHIPNDYYTYGGITRPVEIQYVPDVYIESVHATPCRRKNGGWSLNVEIQLHNRTGRLLERSVRVEIAGQSCELGPVSVRANDIYTATKKITVDGVASWSPQSPRLYLLSTVLLEDDREVDDLIDRIGFREVRVKGKEILLNGESIRLRGYNRHEDHPQFGCSIPVEGMVADLNIIGDLGCNFVRTSHYPNDMRFLDLCDEMGFFVWEESHTRTVDFRHPKFESQIEAVTREMVEWHFNHPSIIIWGCLNECESETRFGRKHHKKVIDLIRSLDPSRPVSFADNRYSNDICFDLVDIVSMNIYTGWYKKRPEDVGAHIDTLIKWLNGKKSSGGKGKPLIISEFGAGAEYGCRHRSRMHWSEEYQCDILDESLRVYLNHSDICGACIWQFSDVRVTEEKRWWATRPRTMNNKGTVDEYRRPKLCYDIVKRRMHEARKHHGV